MYPELQEMPQIGDEPPPMGESDMSDELIGLKKVFEETSKTLPEVVKRFERLESKMAKLNKTIRKRVISG